MNARTALRAALRHVTGTIAGVTVVATTLVAAGVASAGGTYALWSDARPISTSTITSGTPSLAIEGVQGLDHSYEPDALEKQGTVTVANLGDTSLTGFTVDYPLQGGSQALHDAVTVTFTSLNPGDAGAVYTDDTWLGNLTLGPGESADYTMTTRIDELDLLALALQEDREAAVAVTITASAGSWTVVAEATYVQAVLEPVVQGAEDFNTRFSYPNYPSNPWPNYQVSNFVFQWDPSNNGNSIPNGTTWNVFSDGIPLTENHGSFPQYSLNANLMQRIAWPAVGQTAPIVFTVLPDLPGWTVPVAQLTMWMTVVDSNFAYFTPTDPSASRASVSAAPAPASRAPSSSAAAPAAPAPAAPAPVAPTPAPTLTPTPTPEPAPTPTPEPAPTPAPGPAPAPDPAPPPTPDPAPTPTPTPEAITEVELAVDAEADGSLRLSWPNPADIPDGTSYALELDGQAAGERAGTDSPVLAVQPADIPPALWTAEGDVHEVAVEIVAELPGGTTRTIARGTIWVTAAASSTFTLHPSDPGP